MSRDQGIAVFLLLILVILGLARSAAVQQFFSSSLAAISGNLGATAHGQAVSSTATSQLDWHLFLYWFIGGLLVVAFSDVAPRVVIAILSLIILEELLVHWGSYAQYLSLPTK